MAQPTWYRFVYPDDKNAEHFTDLIKCVNYFYQKNGKAEDIGIWLTDDILPRSYYISPRAAAEFFGLVRILRSQPVEDVPFHEFTPVVGNPQKPLTRAEAVQRKAELAREYIGQTSMEPRDRERLMLLVSQASFKVNDDPEKSNKSITLSLNRVSKPLSFTFDEFETTPLAELAGMIGSWIKKGVG